MAIRNNSGFEEIDLISEYVKENDQSIEDILLSPKSRNILRFNGITGLSELISMPQDELHSLQFASEQFVSEICITIEDYIESHMDGITAFEVNRIQSTSLEDKSGTGGIESTSHAQNLLYGVEEREQIIDALEKLNLNIPITSIKLSVRAYNCLKKKKLDYVTDIIRLYPDGFSRIRNLGAKTADELRSIIENYVEDNINGIDAVMAGEDYTGYLRRTEQPAETIEETVSICNEALAKNGDSLRDSIVGNPVFKSTIIQYFKANDVPIDAMVMSVRTRNCLTHEKAASLSKIIEMYPDGYARIRNAGKKTVDELLALVEEYVRKNADLIPDYYACSPESAAQDKKIEYSDNYIEQCILGLYTDNAFRGLSFDEMRAACPESVDDSRLKHIIGTMIRDKKLEYVEFRCYRIYPSVFDILVTSGAVTDREESIFLQRVDGSTLEEIGKNLNITRERVRQIEKNAVRKISRIVSSKKYLVSDEDYYKYFYVTYKVPKEFWPDFSGVSSRTLGYLELIYKKGAKDLTEALEDEQLSVGLRLRIQDYLDRDTVLINGVKIPHKIIEVENYVISVYCSDTIKFDDFAELYNHVLEQNQIGTDSGLYISEDNRRTRLNRISGSRKCLWKYGEKLRYYDIDAGDYSELMAAIGLENYSNTEISTLKLFTDYPEIMQKYDIRDQYELHNLLNKTVDEADYPGLEIKTQPMLKFGEFDRNAAMMEIITMLSPVTQEELLHYLISEYGYLESTLKMAYLPQFDKYLSDGVYDIGLQTIPKERKEQFLESLTDDFYPLRTLSGMYRHMFPDADSGELNARALKEMGFKIYSEYAVRNFSSLEAYYRHILKKDGTCTIKDKLTRYSSTVTFYSTYMNMRRQHEIFLCEPDEVVSMERLSKIGITEQTISDFTDSVLEESENRKYFTVYSLKAQGFTTELDRLGFDDFFLSSILAVDERFKNQRVFRDYVFSRDSGQEQLTVKDFVLYLLSEYDSIYVDDFIDMLSDDYGLECSDNDKSKIIGIVKENDNGYHYDGISRKIFRNKELYYAFLDD